MVRLSSNGMRTLFIYPEFPKTFWSYEKILELVNRKVLLPPLGLVTVCLLYTSPSPRDKRQSRMPSSA